MLDQCRMFQALTNLCEILKKKNTINTPSCLVCFVFPIQTTSCFPGNLPFVFSLIMHMDARGCTCIKRHLKKKINTVLWGSVTWSVMRKQNHNVKTSIIAELSRFHIISIKMSFSAASSLFCRHLQHLGKRSISFSHSC